MDDTGEGLRATRRQVLGATAGALAVGALLGRSSAQQASGPTVYVGSWEHDGNFSGTLYAVDAATGEQEWVFTQPSDDVKSSPTVVDGTVYVGSRRGGPAICTQWMRQRGARSGRSPSPLKRWSRR